MEDESPIVSRLLQHEQLSRDELFSFLEEEVGYLVDAYGMTFPQALVDHKISTQDSLAMREPVDLDDPSSVTLYREEQAILVAIKQWFSRFHSTSMYKD